MMKKIIIALLATLPLLASAQSTGKWITHTRFTLSKLQNVVDTKDKVYGLVNNSLYCLNKSDRKLSVIDNQNALSGSLISNIYYNPDKQYLVITYDDSNIDILHADGKVTNIPNIKDAVMTQQRTINDVTFSGDKIFVATQFGFVVINDATGQIVETRVYSINVSSIAEVGKWRIAFYPSGNVYYCPTNAVQETFSGYKSSYIYGLASGKIFAINDSTMLVRDNTKLRKVVIRENESGELAFVLTDSVAAVATNVQKTPSGYLANFFAGKYYYTFDTEGNTVKKNTLSAQELVSCSPDADGSFWGINANGFHSLSQVATYYMPEAVNIVGIPFWMGYNKNTHKLYLTATSDNGILPSANAGALYEINKFDGSKWEYSKPSGTAGSQGWYWPIFDPNDSTDTYYISSRLSGQFKVTDNAVAKIINASNSPFVARKAAIRFDTEGNLWMVHSSLSNTVPVKVLPKDKVKSGNFTTSDWTVYKVPDVTNTNSFKYSFFDISNKSMTKAFNCGDYNCPLIVWRNNPDLSIAEFESKSFTGLNASDGSTCTWLYSYALRADLNDQMLFGFDKGAVIFNPVEAFNEDFTVKKIKALDGAKVYAIEVDTLNQKWVGTAGDGLYLFSPDCEETLQHFTTGNSPLLSNVIYQVCCNTDNNSIFVVTPLGVQQFFTDYVVAAEDYSNVYAYPNPVRPDFTGWVTITGLMSNSNVEIKDASGKVVKSFAGTAADVMWDCCDENGERLPTGNYSVFAAQPGDEMPEKPFTKVMVIK